MVDVASADDICKRFSFPLGEIVMRFLDFYVEWGGSFCVCSGNWSFQKKKKKDKTDPIVTQ